MSEVRTIWVCPSCEDWQVDFDGDNQANTPQIVEDVLREHVYDCFGLTELLAGPTAGPTA